MIRGLISLMLRC